MKILLVKPKPALKTILCLKPILFLEPIELAYLAASVPPEHEVRILDLRLESGGQFERFQNELETYHPDVIGFSAYTHESSIVKKLSVAAKSILPSVVTLVGGHHATVLPSDYCNNSIDYAVRGEGSLAFRKIIKTLERRENPANGVNVLALSEKMADGVNSSMPPYPDLDDIPFARRDLYDYKNYSCIWPSEKRQPEAPMFPNAAMMRTSYGCLMNCSFCVVPTLSGRKHLIRSPELAAEEISRLLPEHIYFCDDETFINAEHAGKLCLALAAANVNKKYFAWARATTVNRKPELFEMWSAIGLDSVFLGFESGSDKTLKAVSKNSTVAENEKAHSFLRRNKIAVIAGFMVMPDFDENDFDELEKYIVNMEPAQLNITVCTPSPGSPAWEAEHGNFVCNPFDFHDCMHPLVKTKLPLKLFYERFSHLVSVGVSKNPLNLPSAKIAMPDIARVIKAGRDYSESLRNAYKDFPEELWNL